MTLLSNSSTSNIMNHPLDYIPSQYRGANANLGGGSRMGSSEG